MADQYINFSGLSACAQQCTALTNARTGCVPPAAAVTDQTTYNSCFCQSAFLTTLKTSGAVCGDVCTSATDQSAIQQWYSNYCASGGSAAAAPGANNGQTTTLTTSDTAATTTAATTAGSTSGKNSSSSTHNQSWISTHWQWVIFLVVVFGSMILISIFGVWYKRRRRARRDLRGANLAAQDAPISPVPPPCLPPPMAQTHASSTLSSAVDLSSAGGVAAGAAGVEGPSSGHGTPMRPRQRGELQSQPASRGLEGGSSYDTPRQSNTDLTSTTIVASTPSPGPGMSSSTLKGKDRGKSRITEVTEPGGSSSSVGEGWMSSERSAAGTPVDRGDAASPADGKLRRKLSKRQG